jgi:hypothetical protein
MSILSSFRCCSRPRAAKRDSSPLQRKQVEKYLKITYYKTETGSSRLTRQEGKTAYQSLLCVLSNKINEAQESRSKFDSLVIRASKHLSPLKDDDSHHPLRSIEDLVPIFFPNVSDLTTSILNTKNSEHKRVNPECFAAFKERLNDTITEPVRYLDLALQGLRHLDISTEASEKYAESLRALTHSPKSVAETKAMEGIGVILEQAIELGLMMAIGGTTNLGSRYAVTIGISAATSLLPLPHSIKTLVKPMTHICLSALSGAGRFQVGSQIAMLAGQIGLALSGAYETAGRVIFGHDEEAPAAIRSPNVSAGIKEASIRVAQAAAFRYIYSTISTPTQKSATDIDTIQKRAQIRVSSSLKKCLTETSACTSEHRSELRHLLLKTHPDKVLSNDTTSDAKRELSAIATKRLKESRVKK